MRLPDKKINPENAAPDQPDILPNESGYTRKKSRFKGIDPKGDKLRFGRKKEQELKKTSHVSSAVLTQRMHAEIEKQDQDDNIGTEAVNHSTEMAEEGSYALRDTVSRVRYGQKLHASKKEASAAEKTAQKAAENAEATVETAGAAGKTTQNPVTSGYASRLHERRETTKQPKENTANWFSRWRQRQSIKAEYQAARTGEKTGSAAAVQSTKTFTEKIRELFGSAAETITEHPGAFLTCGLLALVLMFVTSTFSSCTAISGNPGATILATSYTATDEDIRGANNDYTALEQALRNKLNNVERDHPGYDEYRYNTNEIGHNPYQLTAFLTVLYEDYTRAEVQDKLQELFDLQYDFSTRASSETTTETRMVRVGESLGPVVTSGYCSCPICCGRWAGGPTASGVMPTANHTIAVDASHPIVPMGTKIVMNGVEYKVEDTGAFSRYGVSFDVYYDNHSAALAHGHKTWVAYIADDNGKQSVPVTQTVTKRILTVTLTNDTLAKVIAEYPLTDSQRERYDLLMQTKGNRSYLFEDDIYASDTPGLKYTLNTEALSDVKFANMMREATKYLGYPYVWGGSSPSTSFDCSGFVCWVINHSGNGWNVGRTTAEGLRQMLRIIPASEAKPGDIIFFQGTYDTPGASHVGIYVGDGMMIHCGNPIQYASVNSSYFKAHFYCYGRLPSE